MSRILPVDLLLPEALKDHRRLSHDVGRGLPRLQQHLPQKLRRRKKGNSNQNELSQLLKHIFVVLRISRLPSGWLE